MPGYDDLGSLMMQIGEGFSSLSGEKED